MPDLVAEHLVFVCCWSLVKMLPEDAHHGEKLRDVTLSQKGRDGIGCGIGPPASLSSGGAYDIVCCAVVGLIFPGLEARSRTCQPRCDASDQERPNIFHCSSPKARILLYCVLDF